MQRWERRWGPEGDREGGGGRREQPAGRLELPEVNQHRGASGPPPAALTSWARQRQAACRSSRQSAGPR